MLGPCLRRDDRVKTHARVIEERSKAEGEKNPPDAEGEAVRTLPLLGQPMARTENGSEAKDV